MDPGLLLIILFIVAPLIEKLIKAGKQQQPPDEPPQRRPQAPRPPRPVEEERAPQVQIPRRPPPRETDDAVDILPDDLWAILTGQQPAPRPVPRRLPEPAREPVLDRPEPLPTRPERGHSYDEAEALSPAHEIVLHDATEYVPMHETPRVVSMEQLEFDDEKRHAKFHERLEALPAAPSSRPVPRVAAHRFTSDADLRRAIIMTEVLGKPKGLE